MSGREILVEGHQYLVTEAFTDYDGIEHPAGESWTYVGYTFLPYEDGLTLQVLQADQPRTIRLQWRPEAQAHIIDHLGRYLRAI